jgi:hypothetical protein
MAVSLLLGPTLAGGEERPLLAVMDVQDSDVGLDSAITNNLTEYLRGLLAETGRYVVIDRGRQAAAVTQLVRKEKKESYKACYDRSCQVPLGRSLAADRILITSMMRIGSRVIVKAEIVDLATEASQGGATVKVSAKPANGLEDRLTEALDELVGKLVGSLNAAPAVSPVEGGVGAALTGTIISPGGGTDSLQREWLDLNKLAEDNRIPQAARIAAIDQFGAKIGAGSPYASETRELREYIAAGPDYYRTKTEWAALNFNATTMGLGFNASFFTLRWNKFYVQLLQGSWTGNDDEYTGSVGMGLGYPIHLDGAGRHELRLGADVDFWTYWDYYFYDDYSVDGVDPESSGEFIGTGITPRVTYVFHAARHLSLHAGLESMLSLIPWSSGSSDYQFTFGGNVGVGF